MSRRGCEDFSAYISLSQANVESLRSPSFNIPDVCYSRQIISYNWSIRPRTFFTELHRCQLRKLSPHRSSLVFAAEPPIHFHLHTFKCSLVFPLLDYYVDSADSC
jgi:hypothetical protein